MAVALMLVVTTSWNLAATRWAPFVLTTLCPFRRFYEPWIGKKLTDWAGRLIGYLGRYVVNLGTGLSRACVLIGNRAYYTYELLATVQRGGVALAANMRLDARLFAVPPARAPGQVGCPTLIGRDWRR